MIQGQGDSTEFKQRGLSSAFWVNLRIFQARFGQDPRARYFHFDLNSGNGMNEDAGCIGSPLAFVRTASAVGCARYFAGFVDHDKRQVQQLLQRPELRREDCFMFQGDNREFVPQISGGTKWLSVEPMLQPLKFSRLNLFDWVVVGGASASNQTPEWVPPIDWISDLHQQSRKAGCRIYYKDNCGMSEALRIREFPWVEPQPRDLPDSFKYLAGLK